MYECPNCSANLKYNISKQALFCEHCSTTMDPYSFYKESDAEESTSFGVTIFTCPQCGGELMTDDTTAATFCSFCGSSTILDSRVSMEKCPDYIIPFSLDEDACKKSYKKMMRRAIFAPKELSDPEHIQKFRGIYMPYWVYSFGRKGQVTFDGQRRKRKGDYIHTKHYDIDCEVDMEYDGLAYDASSTFYDSLSDAIAPFHTDKGQPFHLAFLSGFYADTSDIDERLYREDAQNIAWGDAIHRIRKKPIFFSYEKPSIASLKNALFFPQTTESLGLFPVWFLSYKKDDRVAYAVINGQTGRAAADLPVDKKKYLIGSALLTLPIFLLLNILFTIKPTTLLWFSIVLSLLCIFLASKQMTHIKERETFANDKGVLGKSTNETFMPEEYYIKKKQTDRNLLVIKLVVAFSILLVVWAISYMMRIFSNTMSTYMVIMMLWMCLPIFIIPIFTMGSKLNKEFFKGLKQKLPYVKYPLISIVLAILILIWNPVYDIFYYIGVIVCMLMAALTFTDLIELHNRLTTRKLPQLNKRGGDENA